MTCVIHVGRVDWSEEQTMRAVQLTAYGSPGEGLKFVDIPEPVPPRANQVLLGIEYSPINMSDLLVAYGVYPLRPTLPTVIGNEGVGRVVAMGPGVQNVKVGDRVLAPLNSFAWTERVVVPADDLFALPPDADVQQLAMAGINPPTAALLLSQFVDLKPGDWVAQNAANSGVGRSLIAIARTRGLRTINFVRRAELVPELEAAGGDLVLLDVEGALDKVRVVGGGGRMPLGIDGVAGKASATVAGALSDFGTLVVYAHERRASHYRPARPDRQACHREGVLPQPFGYRTEDF